MRTWEELTDSQQSTACAISYCLSEGQLIMQGIYPENEEHRDVVFAGWCMKTQRSSELENPVDHVN